jgi:hypothetical protein
MNNLFKFIMPAELEKGSTDGEWKVKGLASTGHSDQQGETIMQKGIDLSPIDKKKGVLNWDHGKSPEDTIGILDGYQQGENGLYIEGRLFKNHSKAKAVKEIMDSLGEGDRGRMGLSVEGQILERDTSNPKIIRKCRINAVALTMNPVNSNTYADLVKSMNASDVEFDAQEQSVAEDYTGEVTFTATQVVEMVNKALSAGAAATKAPAARTGGEALSMQSMDKDKPKVQGAEDEYKKPKKKKMKKMDKNMYKSNMLETIDKMAILYPECTKAELWAALRERLTTTFPSIEEEFGKGRGPDKAPRKKKLNEKIQVSKYEERPGAKKLREKMELKTMKENLKPSNVFKKK